MKAKRKEIREIMMQNVSFPLKVSTRANAKVDITLKLVEDDNVQYMFA